MRVKESKTAFLSSRSRENQDTSRERVRECPRSPVNEVVCVFAKNSNSLGRESAHY